MLWESLVADALKYAKTLHRNDRTMVTALKLNDTDKNNETLTAVYQKVAVHIFAYT